MNNYSGSETVNAGTGKELTIKELTELVAETVGYEGEIKWDTSRPNGTPRKLLDVKQSHKARLDISDRTGRWHSFSLRRFPFKSITG